MLGLLTYCLASQGQTICGATSPSRTEYYRRAWIRWKSSRKTTLAESVLRLSWCMSVIWHTKVRMGNFIGGDEPVFSMYIVRYHAPLPLLKHACKHVSPCLSIPARGVRYCTRFFHICWVLSQISKVINSHGRWFQSGSILQGAGLVRDGNFIKNSRFLVPRISVSHFQVVREN